MNQNLSHREELKKQKRIVIKLGSRVLLNEHGEADWKHLDHLVSQIAQLLKKGYEPIVVSSGAIAVGMNRLQKKRRPKTIPGLQMAAAVGQTLLSSEYEKRFKKKGLCAAQVLLTHDDLRHRQRHLNARNTLMGLIHEKIVPIINENDTVAVDEIKFGDNDALASLVAILCQADLLILLSSTDGLHKIHSPQNSERLPFIPSITKKTFELIQDNSNDPLSTGGMTSKLTAAQMATTRGINVIMAHGKELGIIQNLLKGKDKGTYFQGKDTGRKLVTRKQWLAHFHRPQGKITIDDGAIEALRKRGKSLLAVGAKEIQGHFPMGALVDIVSSSNELIARGLVSYSDQECRAICGKSANEIKQILGQVDFAELIHRDNMVIFEENES